MWPQGRAEEGAQVSAGAARVGARPAPPETPDSLQEPVAHTVGSGVPCPSGSGGPAETYVWLQLGASLTGQASLQGRPCRQRSATRSSWPPHGWGGCGGRGTRADSAARAVLELLQAQRKLPGREGRVGPEADPPAGARAGAASDPQLCSPASAPPQGRGLTAGSGQASGQR